ncbi:hypothetical protein ABZ949_15220 [Micromonospora tulbaghiae]|uniref:hypothetical protein n=1 Tax=Micromonospora tulbaghiae TaxID=479978 RepID=UPI0033F12AF8
MIRRLWVVSVLAGTALFAVPVTVVGVHVAHPRNESGYLVHLEQYGDRQNDRPLALMPPTADLVAEGDAACDWLREQPYALWRHAARPAIGDGSRVDPPLPGGVGTTPAPP